jgi:hypothetical protein
VSRRADAGRLDVVIDEGCVLTFCHLLEEADTLLRFDGTPWHAHGVVQCGTGNATYVEYDELEILTALGAGDLVIVREYADGPLRDRSLAHRLEPLPDRYMEPGDEIRVRRLPVRTGHR